MVLKIIEKSLFGTAFFDEKIGFTYRNSLILQHIFVLIFNDIVYIQCAKIIQHFVQIKGYKMITKRLQFVMNLLSNYESEVKIWLYKAGFLKNAKY